MIQSDHNHEVFMFKNTDLKIFYQICTTKAMLIFQPGFVPLQHRIVCDHCERSFL